MHILVVEDEQRLARLLRRVLMEERQTVDLVHDGSSALEFGLSGTYDLIVLDLMLPDLDGISICKELRAANIVTPILMLTARGSVEDRVAGLNAGSRRLPGEAVRHGGAAGACQRSSAAGKSRCRFEFRVAGR